MQTRSRLLACAALISSAVVLSLALDLGHTQNHPSIDISQDLLTTYDIPNAAGEYGTSFLVDRNRENRRVGGFQAFNHDLPEGSFTITPAGVTRLFTCGSDVTWTQVQAVNEQGAMAGWCATRTGDTWSVSGFYRSEGGTITRLRYPGAAHTEARDVNDQEEVVGWYRPPGSGSDHGFRWDRRTNRYTSLVDPTGIALLGTYPHTITNAGMIGATVVAEARWFAGIFRQGQWTLIRFSESAAFTHLLDDGRLLGTQLTREGLEQRFLWQDGVFTFLAWPSPMVDEVHFQRLTPGNLFVGHITRHKTPPPNTTLTVTQGFVAPLAAVLAPDDGPPPPAMAARMAHQPPTEPDATPPRTVERTGCPDDPPVAGTTSLARQMQTWAFCDRLR